MRTRITARFVVGFAGGDHVVYERGEVVFEGDTILFAGHGFPDEVDVDLDAGDAIVSPGFIDLDALADVDHAILDCWGSSDRLKGMRWSEDYFHASRHDLFDREDQARNRHYALAQLLLNGVTTALPIAAETYKAWAETYEEFADIVAIGRELGIRLYLGPSYRAGVNVTRADGTPDILRNEELGWDGFRQAVAFAREFDGANGGLVRAMLAPARIETLTLDLLRASKEASDELACPIRLHAAQSRQEITYLDRWYGTTPIELLHELEFLGPRTLIPHAIYLRGRHGLPPGDHDEVRLLAESGTTVIYCPLANARYGGLLDSFDAYRAAGVNIGLGTDTFPPDLIQAMAFAHAFGKSVSEDSTACAFADLYRALTLGGAHALGRDDLGRLAPGARADITVVDLSALRTGLIDDPIRTLIFNTTGACVRDVFVNGRHVVENGAIPGLDVAALRAWAQDYFDRYTAAFSAWDYQLRPAAELFPPSFPTVAPPSG
jgi:cytosine/adenosine deaminase-related metal-dependent hydrolase